MLHKLRLALALVKFSHTIFALPFALASGLLAVRSLPPSGPEPRPWLFWFGWIIVAMVGARTAAMAFNRIVDLRFDRKNPRARGWPLVSGELSVRFAWGIFFCGVALLLLAAWRLNPLALKLALPSLAIVCFYSLTKRFTAFTHFFLGLALGIAPVGAWVAVTGRIGAPALWLSLAVLLWVAGFDLMYHCQDVAIDSELGLHSLPITLGIRGALRLSAILHLGMIAALVTLGLTLPMGPVYFAGTMLLAAVLLWEHLIVKANDLSRINVAFFTLNGWIAVLFFFAVAGDLWLR